MGRKRKRRNLGSIDDRTAQQLLSRYLKIGRAFASLWPHVELEELLSAARIAILEAHLSYDASRGLNKDSWVRRQIFWGMSDAASKLRSVPLESLGVDPQVVNGASPEQQFWRTTALRAVAQLSPRHQVLVTAWIQGETFAEAGATIGVSGALAHRETHRALAQLREILESPDLC